LRKPTLRKSDYQIDRQIISTEVGGDLAFATSIERNMPLELEIQGEARRSLK
jgi:hypothetical protein